MSENQTLAVMPTEQLTVMKPENAQHLIRNATDVAGVCKEIVLKSACNIQGKKYIKAEGWMSIATAHGCIASSRDVKKVEGGFTAIGEIRRMADGVVLSTAEGFVGRDEKRWGQADEYACRAMAQTRAISRACRAAFAHIVVLMDAGLSTTPFEEIPEGGFTNTPPQHQSAPNSQPEGKEQPTSDEWREFRIPFGKNKDKQLGELGDKSLLWYCENIDNRNPAFRNALNEAAKEMFPDGGDDLPPDDLPM